jgi:hypothetical protein
MNFFQILISLYDYSLNYSCSNLAQDNHKAYPCNLTILESIIKEVYVLESEALASYICISSHFKIVLRLLAMSLLSLEQGMLKLNILLTS